MIRVLTRIRRPDPQGAGQAVDHTAFVPILASLSRGGSSMLPDIADDLSRYVADLTDIDPDRLGRDEALAFWLNLYNAGALRLAAEASAAGLATILRVPGGFHRPLVTIGNERLSLDAIEHAKIRRFGDPRIHGALVCGSVSCPTLRSVPYQGTDLDRQLDDQMRTFLASGAATLKARILMLSRVFRWYGGDFVRPNRMPVFLPVSRRAVATSLIRWLPIELAGAVTAGVTIGYQPYDWGLRCTVA